MKWKRAYEDFHIVNHKLVPKPMCDCDNKEIEPKIRRTCKNCGGLW